MTAAAATTGTVQARAAGDNGPARGEASVHFERERGVCAVQVRRGLSHVTVHLPASDVAGSRLALLHLLAGAGVPVFLVKLHPCALSFAVRSPDAARQCETLLVQQGMRYALRGDLGLITVVAGAMRDMSGIMAQIYQALVGANVGVQQTGDAYNAVILLVENQAVDRAARALRQTFALTGDEDAAACEPAPAVPETAAAKVP